LPSFFQVNPISNFFSVYIFNPTCPYLTQIWVKTTQDCLECVLVAVVSLYSFRLTDDKLTITAGQ